MAYIRPFRAARPAPGLAAKVAALPYDVMNSDEARVEVDGNPYSFMRVTKSEVGLDKSVGLYDDAVYAKAKEKLDGFVKDGVLVQDATPCFYIYRQTAFGRSQTGLVVCVSVDDYLSGAIKRHELTLEKKELDRIRHIDTTNANTGPVFLAYKDRPEIAELISGITAKTPACDFVSPDGVGHTVWVVDDNAKIKQIESAFNNVDALYIADGHHRAASTAKVCKKRREAGCGSDSEANFFLAVAFPGGQLNCMDYNRAVKTLNGNTESEFLKLLEKIFIVEEKPAAYKPERLHTMGMYLGGKWRKLTVRDGFIGQDPVAALDVSILQDNVLKPILGIDDPRTSPDIEFIGGIRGLAELERRVNSGSLVAAFAMFPTPVSQLFEVSDAGRLMPPKSTWFEPKLRSGLFVHFLE